MTKTFKNYLAESARQYDFRIKIAGEVTPCQESALESLLSKFQVANFKKSGKTPIQDLPLDFPKIKNAEVNIYEVTLEYPSTQWELQEYISTNLGITKDALVVRKPGEPLEEYQQVATAGNLEPLLTDPDYKEAENASFDEFYGDKYNSGFVKELNDILKLQRKERGEEIPSDTTVKYNTDSAEGKTSVLKQAEDPRKK